MSDLTNLRPKEIAEQLKDVAGDLGLVSLCGTKQDDDGNWTKIDVRHAALLSDSRDGWDVTIEEHSL